ncbi:GntR family transcriptional regulator [uncultured Gilliamella sp.]|uniref:GntR family transcriptional regulator n=1 Tax=uncultured Gilliamella sp. TaxID=1193505 RepID=UPI003425C0E8
MAVKLKKKDFIAQDLLGRIYQQTNFTNQKLPPERELAETYGVSRHTIRKALEKLTQIGIISIIKGSGAFINQQTKNSPLIYNSITEKHYDQISSKLILFRKRRVQLEEKQTFNLSDDEYIWEFHRIRYVDKQGTQIEVSKLPYRYFPDLKQKIIENSIQQYVLSKGYEISHYLTQYQAVAINRSEAELLKCKKGIPAMKIINRCFLKNGTIYAISEIIDIHYTCTYITPFNKPNLEFRLVDDKKNKSSSHNLFI